jgi:hypothetical protein
LASTGICTGSEIISPKDTPALSIGAFGLSVSLSGDATALIIGAAAATQGAKTFAGAAHYFNLEVCNGGDFCRAVKWFVLWFCSVELT